MFEQEYSRANDRIHPRKDLLKEMEAKWAAQENVPAEEEEQKVVSLPAWVRIVSIAAGVVLCVGVGMGSTLLFGRSRGLQNKSAAVDAPLPAENALVEEEPRILTETAEPEAAPGESEADGGQMVFEAKLTAAKQEPPQGMHIAMDEAEVENALSYEDEIDFSLDAEVPQAADAAANNGPILAAGAAEATEAESYPAGEAFLQDDLLHVYLPTEERVQVARYASRKITNVFALTLREQGARVKRIFWMGGQLLAVRERGGETELLRFDVSNWNQPRHLKNLTQSGAFLDAREMDGKLCVLSLYEATEEEPLPWVNGERIDYTNVLLDEARAGDTFTVLTVYDPAQDGVAAQTALLAECAGAVYGPKGLLLWTEGEETALYRFACEAEGLRLAAEAGRTGRVLTASASDKGFSLLLQAGNNAVLSLLDEALQEADASSDAVGAVRRAEFYDDMVIYLTEDALHLLTVASHRSLPLTGDAFVRLTADRLLVISADGKLQLVAFGAGEPEALGAAELRDSLQLLAEDPSRLAFDPDTGRLVFPVGQKVYQYLISETGDMTQRGMPQVFGDHNETEQRELRCLLGPDEAYLFTKSAIVVCDKNFARRTTGKY